MEYIRSFIAIEIPEEVKKALAKLEDTLKGEGGIYVKWVEPCSIHITLKFLGNVASGKIPQIVQALSSIIQSIPPFSLELGEKGVFPNIQQTQVIWVGVKGETDKLQTLQKGIEKALIPFGFPAESRPFVPHLTIGRLREKTPSQERRRLGQIFMATSLEKTPPFLVKDIVLMKSQLTPEGPIYTPLASLSLGGLPRGGI